MNDLFKFRDRLKLSKKIESWCQEVGVSNEPMNAIAYLHSKGMLDIPRIQSELEK